MFGERRTVLIRIVMPTRGDKLVEWEDCVLAFREKQKREWEKKKAQQTGK